MNARDENASSWKLLTKSGERRDAARATTTLRLVKQRTNQIEQLTDALQHADSDGWQVGLEKAGCSLIADQTMSSHNGQGSQPSHKSVKPADDWRAMRGPSRS